MKFENKHAIICLLILLLLPCLIFAQQVLIWDNDEDSDFLDPEGTNEIGCEYKIQQALTENEITFTTVSTLPGDLSDYDVVFVTLGIYCLD
ncbi:MAG: hypothetical protein K8S23_15070 [Candidatus Cloacimonetes bacterium]|nr:hypothetical protein [Candidatus Cloacimonadota bacterium]